MLQIAKEPMSYISLEQFHQINRAIGKYNFLLNHMHFENRPVGQGWLSRKSGLTLKTVSKAMKMLYRLEMVAPAGQYQWSITPKFCEFLTLMFTMSDPNGIHPQPPAAHPAAGGDKKYDRPAVETPASGKLSHPSADAQLQLPLPAGDSTPGAGKNDDRPAVEMLPGGKLSHPSADTLAPLSSPTANQAAGGGKKDDRDPSLSRKNDDLAFNTDKSFKDLKVLKDLKNTTTAILNDSLDISSSSNLNARARNFDEKYDLEIEQDDIQPCDMLDDTELADFLRPYLVPNRADQPIRILFEHESYAEVLDFVLRHACSIARTPFEIDDWLLQQEQQRRTKTNAGVYKLLYAVGVRNKKLFELARSKHCSVEYVISHLAIALHRGDQDVRLLITRIAASDKAEPVDPETSHLKICTCSDCSVGQFAGDNHAKCEVCGEWPCKCGLFDEHGKLI
jgi:hypothetical protein